MTHEPHTPAPDKVSDEARDALRELNELRKECSFAPKLWAETVLRLTDRAVSAITALRAALTAAEAQLAERDAATAQQCCMCGKKGLSTEEDGGPECELHDGRWVCSRECYERAIDDRDAAIAAAYEAAAQECKIRRQGWLVPYIRTLTPSEALAALERVKAEERGDVAGLVEALRFYADEDEYETNYETLPCDCCTDIYEPVMRDCGDKARAALAAWEGRK